MHELSIALNILEIAAEEAERRGGVAVRAVHLKLGSLAGIAKESLLSAYDLAREGSLLADARLVVEEVPVVVCCPVCQAENRVASFPELCSCCGATGGNVVQGRELEIVALEIEE
jgi:hydrogenase nickel incorporation protein HypA/HybF